jgi:hypothetical protein
MGCNTCVHESNARNISVQLSFTQLAKMFCLPYAYVFSSTKLERRAEQVLPKKEGGRGEEWGRGKVRRNDPNNVCTCE